MCNVAGKSEVEFDDVFAAVREDKDALKEFPDVNKVRGFVNEAMMWRTIAVFEK